MGNRGFRPFGRSWGGTFFVIGALVGLLAVTAADASAATAPEPLWQRCDGGAETVSCGFPRGIGVNPASGNLYLADQTHQRIVELTAWGEFVRAWGWGVVDGSSEAQVCTVASECRNGIAGEGRGQLNIPQGVAVDSAGGVYVFDLENKRVEKFDSEGHFLFMVGGEVNKTKSEEGGSTEAQRNLCPVDPSDVCQKGTGGTGHGQFNAPFGAPTANLAVGPAPEDRLYVGDKERIQVFDSSGHYLEEVPKSAENGLIGGTVESLAAGPSGTLYVAFIGKANVRRLRVSNGTKFGAAECEVAKPSALAMAQTSAGAPTGNLYAFDESGTPQARQFKASCAEQIEAPFAGGEVSGSTGIAASVACLEAETASKQGPDLYLSNSVFGSASFVRAYGPTPDRTSLCHKPALDPRIVSQFASSVGSTEAALKAQIDPRFNPTSYFVQYGTAACVGAEDFTAPCAARQPVPPGVLAAPDVDFPFPTAAVPLTGLSPDTEYRYRFVAVSHCNELKPNEECVTDGAPRSFRTFTSPGAGGGCPNEAFRTGPSANLPDCRAYEMVSPVDKEGGEVFALNDAENRPAQHNQSATSGERFTYTSYRAFADAEAAPEDSQYIATREAGGWSSANISPPRGIGYFPPGGSGKPNPSPLSEYQAFSPDLCSAWIDNNAFTEPPLAPGAVPFNYNLYRRSNCGPGAGGYAALGRVQESAGTLQGTAAGGGVAILHTGAHLVQDVASPVGETLFCTSPTPLKSSSFTRQWLRDGTLIASATAETYKAKAEDAGHVVQCRMTATGEGGAGTTQVTNPAFAIDPYPSPAPPVAPKSIPAPSASGPLEVGGAGGQALGCAPGAWEGSPSFEYRWYRDGAPISGAEASQYTTTPADVASAATFQCEVRAKNEGGTVLEASEGLDTSPGPDPAAPVARPNANGEATAYLSSSEGEVRALCVRPGGIVAGGCSAGTGSAHFEDGRRDLLAGAISSNGSRAFWTDSEGGRGRIYLRENPTEPQSALGGGGECTEAEKACTLPVSEAVESPARSSRFWAASTDGGTVLFGSRPSGIENVENLYEYDVDSATTTPIAGKTLGVLGQSADLSRIYFLSREALEGGKEGEEEGKPNLYLRRKGASTTFIAVLSEADAKFEEQLRLSPTNIEPYLHGARVSADGESAAFISNAPLSGYDNADIESGEPDAEVYLYRAGPNKLLCVSCEPGGAQPVGEATGSGKEPYWIAAQLPNIESQLYASHALSEDGSRVFFESLGPLSLGDTNGVGDVYEWEAPGAGGAGGCTTSSSTYSTRDGGCVTLISSGRSPKASELLDATPNGSDVFFRTGASLVPQDPGSFDVYDARVNGGFPPPTTVTPCEGEACQPQAAAHQRPTPASAQFNGAGNPKAAKPRCPKGRRRVVRKGKARCVKRHAHRRHRHHRRKKHRRAHRNARSHR